MRRNLSLFSGMFLRCLSSTLKPKFRIVPSHLYPETTKQQANINPKERNARNNINSNEKIEISQAAEEERSIVSTSGYSIGDLIEIIDTSLSLSKSRHLLGIIVNVPNPHSLSVLLWINKRTTSPCFILRLAVMHQSIRFKVGGWVHKQSLDLNEIIHNKSHQTLAAAMKHFEDESFTTLQEIIRRFSTFNRKDFQTETIEPGAKMKEINVPIVDIETEARTIENEPQIPRALTPERLLKALGFEIETATQLHAAYRFLFHNVHSFAKPPFLGPSGPYFTRTATEQEVISEVLALDSTSLDQFCEQLRQHLATRRRGTGDSPLNSILPPTQLPHPFALFAIEAIQENTLNSKENILVEKDHGGDKNKDSTKQYRDRILLLWALQRVACAHANNNHPLVAIVNRILASIVDEDGALHSASNGRDLYSLLERNALLPKNYNLHWEQSMLHYTNIPSILQGQKHTETCNGTSVEGQKNGERDVTAWNPQLLPDGSLLADRISFQRAIAIDSDDTIEVDDALSIEPVDGSYWRVHVHVADPSIWIKSSSKMESWCALRTSSIYAPEAKDTMIPDRNLIALISLDHDESLALTISFDVAMETGEIIFVAPNEAIRPSIIKRVRRMTYDGADAVLFSSYGKSVQDREVGNGGAEWVGRSKTLDLLGNVPILAEDVECLQTLAAASVALRRAREHEEVLTCAPKFLAAKRFIRSRPSPEIRLMGDEIKIVNGNDVCASPSKAIISELMIAAGRVAAAAAVTLDISVPFRRQDAPTNANELEMVSLLSSSVPPGLSSEALAALGSSLAMERVTIPSSRISLKPGIHWSMGLSSYVRATSPMRRYSDMLVHYGLKAALQSQYRGIEKKMDIGYINEMEQYIRSVQRRSVRFWILTSLARASASKLWDGVVLSVTATFRGSEARCQVYICELYSSFSVSVDGCSLTAALGGDSYEALLAPGTLLHLTVGNIRRDLNQVTWRIAGPGHISKTI